MVEEGLNHATVVDMVTEGVRAAFAENEPTQEQLNNVNETKQLRRQVDEMHNLIEQMNATQQQPTQNNTGQQPFNSPQFPFYPPPANHQPFMHPNNMYNQNSYQRKDWNNHNYQNNNYCGGRGGRGCGGRGSRGGCGGRRKRKYC